MIPVSIVTGGMSSVQYVSGLSHSVLVAGPWSAWQAARVDVEQQTEAAELKATPLEDRVVDKILADTNVDATSSSVS